LQIDASTLDVLLKGYPRLRELKMVKVGFQEPWNPESKAFLEAFKAKLKTKNPKADVSF